MIPHFTLQRGKMEYLIIRMGDEFHIIDCDDALTREKRFAVLESGCSSAEMQEMGLSGMTIPKSDIKELTVTGCSFQDDVIFYLNNRKKLAFWFPQAYEQRKVDDFFRGIPRKMVKTRTRLRGEDRRNWRVRERNYALYKKLIPFGWAWNILCVLTAICPFVLEVSFDLWGWIVMGIAVVTVLLDCFLPAYFSILFRGKHSKRKEPKQAIHLGFGLLTMLGVFTGLCTGRYHLVDFFRALPPALILTVILGIGLFLFCREFMEEPECGIVAVLLILFLSWNTFIPQLNHALGGELTPVTASITDQHSRRTGKRGRTYYCTVTLPDGRTMDIRVSREEYDSYEIGDTMDLQVGTGFFGIDYAIDG